MPVPSPQPWCILLPSPSSVTPASGEGLLLQDNAVSAEIRALLSSYYNDRWSSCDEKLPDLTFYPHKMPLSHVIPTFFCHPVNNYTQLAKNKILIIDPNLLNIQWIIHKLLSLFYFSFTYFISIIYFILKSKKIL